MVVVVLQAEAGLPVDASAPLFSFIGRLEEQKGVDILMAAVPKILAKAPNAQILILGTGKAKFEKQVAAMTAAFPSKAKGVVKFSAPLAHLITAGADFILVPSRFEPCGLIQLHAMQYGTVPIVASTGGLVDTVKEGVTGFHMGALDKDVLDPADVDALASTCARAAQAFSTPLYRQMVYNCISQDLSWAKAAVK
ncbi:starch synthase, chloroplastic/amyloplastic, partial [Haematococcus lacustris]